MFGGGYNFFIISFVYYVKLCGRIVRLNMVEIGKDFFCFILLMDFIFLF